MILRWNLGLKCAKTTFIKGKIKNSLNIDINKNTTIKAPDQHDVYKYLRIDENDELQHHNMKTRHSMEYYKRTRAIMRIDLNAKNKMTAITT